MFPNVACLIFAKVSFWVVRLFSPEVSDCGWEWQDWVCILDSPQSGGILCKKYYAKSEEYNTAVMLRICVLKCLLHLN